MTKNAKQLKELSAGLSLQKKGHHERFRKLVVEGFFDTPRTSDEVVTEIQQTTGTRLSSSVVQTYMKKFMGHGVIRVLRGAHHRGNYWILASEKEVKSGQLMLRSENRNNAESIPSSREAKASEFLSLPTHPLLGTNKTQILFLAANPTGTNPLALDRECREIEERIRASQHRDGLEFITKWAVRTKDLLQYLNQHRAHVIHFSGHGSPADELIFLDANENPKSVSKNALKQLFTTLKDNIRVVVLNACYSRPQAEAITEVIDCAIGMKSEIGDQAAIVFAAAFYQAIGFGRSVKEAFDSGTLALMLENIPEETTPELLVRRGVDPNKIFLVGTDR